MNKHIFLITAFFICGCASQDSSMSIKSGQYHPIKPQAVSQAATSEVKTLRINDYVFTQGNFHVNDAFELLTPIEAKSSNLLTPNMSLAKNSILVKSYQQGKFDYYVEAKSTQNSSIGDAVIQEIKQNFKRIDSKGIKQDNQTGEISLFATSGNVEYTYPLPKNSQLQAFKLTNNAKTGNANSLQYVGMENNNLLFAHLIYDNKIMKDNLFFKKTNTSFDTKILKISKDQKIFLVEDKKIEIISIADNQIQLRVLTS